jgi:enoyl-CoA hydratase
VKTLTSMLGIVAVLLALLVVTSPAHASAGISCRAEDTRGINVSIDEGLVIEQNYFARMVPTRDIQEGISAWLEKRKPHFTGT